MKNRVDAEMIHTIEDCIRAGKLGPVLVTRDGKPVGVFLGVKDEAEAERLIVANSPQFQKIIESARQRYHAGKAIPADEFWRRVKHTAKTKRKPSRKKLAV